MQKRRRGNLRKPTQTQLTKALFAADHFVATCGNDDTSHGKIADEILGPILWDYHQLRALLVRAAEAMETGSHGMLPLADEIRKALVDSILNTE